MGLLRGPVPVDLAFFRSLECLSLLLQLRSTVGWARKETGGVVPDRPIAKRCEFQRALRRRHRLWLS